MQKGKGSYKASFWRLAVLWCLFFVAVKSFAFKLPDSDQRKCYNYDGMEISCSGTGQDGAYIINPLSYTDNENGTVTDNHTGLMWQKEDDDKTYNWYMASGTYDATHNPTSRDVCGELNLGEHPDWRLPTKKELITIVDYAIPFDGPTIHPIFTNTNASDHWTATTDASNPARAWYVNFSSSVVDLNVKYVYRHVRCVRGGQTTPSFTDNGNGTVTDMRTGLMWQQGEPGYKSWQGALDYCNGLTLGEHSDWRLPNIKELETITDDMRYTPAIDKTYFPKAYEAGYLSSTTNAGEPSYSWLVNFNFGYFYLSSKGDENYVRCMRGGQAGNPISPPSNLAARAISSSSVVLSWKDKSGNETGFKIERKNGSCSSANQWSQIANKARDAESHTDTGRAANTTYSYRVRAYNAEGNSDYANCASVKTGLAGTPKSPTNLKATSASSSKINLTWNDNSLNEASFKIYRKVGTGTWALLDTKGANIKSHGDTNAPNNSTTTTYSYYIQACNASGCSPATNAAVVPYAPVTLTATATSGKINLKWTDRSAIETGFQVYRKDVVCATAGTLSLIAAKGANVITHSDTGLTSGTAHAYKVRAYKESTSMPYAAGYSLFSNCDDAQVP